MNGSCHLLADSLEELHAFAARLGLNRAWFQGKRLKHYYLSHGIRAVAIRHGALEITDREMVERFMPDIQHPAPSTPHPA
jgi:hypothetical protein